VPHTAPFFYCEMSGMKVGKDPDSVQFYEQVITRHQERMEMELLLTRQHSCKSEQLEVLKRTWNQVKMEKLSDEAVFAKCKQIYLNGETGRDKVVWKAFSDVLRETNFENV